MLQDSNFGIYRPLDGVVSNCRTMRRCDAPLDKVFHGEDEIYLPLEDISIRHSEVLCIDILKTNGL